MDFSRQKRSDRAFFTKLKSRSKMLFLVNFEKMKILEFFEKKFFWLDWEAHKKTSSADLSPERVLSGYRALI